MTARDTLTDAEVLVLLDPCGCGHDLDLHGGSVNCWRCEDDGGKCGVGFVALLGERVGRIVAGRASMRGTGGNRFIPAHSNESELNWAISEGIRDLANYARDTGRLIDPGAVGVETKRIADGRISVSVTGDLRDDPLAPPQGASEGPRSDERGEEAPGADRAAGSASGGVS